MADQIDFNLIRVADGDNAPEALATAYFYEEGTSTPLTVYSDQALTTPHGTSLASDANGIFAPVYTDGTVGVKVDVKDGSGATISGYPLDPARGISLTATGASAISVTPFTGVASTNVQDALEEIYSSIDGASFNFTKLPVTAGVATAFTLTAPETITAYAVGQRFLFRPHLTSTGAATLNVDGLGAKNIQVYTASDTLTSIAAGDIQRGKPAEVIYNGTVFVLISSGTAKSTMPGAVKLLDEDDMVSDSAAAAPSQQSVKAYVDGRTTIWAVDSDRTISAASTFTWAHGLGAIPKSVQAELVCQTGEFNYTAGQVIQVPIGVDASNRGISVIKDATNITVRMGSGTAIMAYPNATTGAGAALTYANWKLRMRAAV